MLAVAILAGAMALWAGFVYLAREGLGASGLGLAALRTLGVAALLLLVFNPGRARRMAGGPPVVLLDASLSMGVPGGKWDSAVDTARAIAGSTGTIYRFGVGLVAFDTTSPSDGSSRLREALVSGRGSGRPLYVVTDGEIEDMAAIDPAALNDVTLVVLPRDTLPDVALLDIAVRERVRRSDSLDVLATVGTWGPAVSDSAVIELSTRNRTIAVRQIDLPPSPGVGRRLLRIPARLLQAGTQVIRFRLVAAGDSVAGDERRARVVVVTEQPDIVVIVDPADWEGRYLVSELSAVARTNVTGYARIEHDVWLDMGSLATVAEETVRDACRRATMLVFRGGADMGEGSSAGTRPVWNWPAGSDPTLQLISGDWYVIGDLPASPLAGQLGLVDWQALPPLTGLAPIAAAEFDWVGLTGRLARRGPERPLLLGKAVEGTGYLMTAGSGLWRWAFRGGAAREAYRTLLASGIDWLLQSSTSPTTAPLTATPVVTNGAAVGFHWLRDSVPDSVTVIFEPVDGSAPDTVTLRFGEGGEATQSLLPGEFRWSAPTVGAGGVVVVEEYSDEIHPRAVHLSLGGRASGTVLAEQYARGRWWLFVVVVLALAGEWGWRYRKGLP